MQWKVVHLFMLFILNEHELKVNVSVHFSMMFKLNERNKLMNKEWLGGESQRLS